MHAYTAHWRGLNIQTALLRLVGTTVRSESPPSPPLSLSRVTALAVPGGTGTIALATQEAEAGSKIEDLLGLQNESKAT